MDKHDITLLVEQNVALTFIVTPATRADTWHLQIKRGLNTTTMTATRGVLRVFRSLDPIAKFVCTELGRGFEVVNS